MPGLTPQLGSELSKYRYKQMILSVALQDIKVWEELADAVEELMGSEVTRPIRQLAQIRNTDVILDEPVLLAPLAITDPGGVLVPGTYKYRVTAFNDFAETIGSIPVEFAIGGPANTIDVRWLRVEGAAGYRIYGRTSVDPNADDLCLIYEVGADAVEFRDSGNLTPIVDRIVPSPLSASRELLVTLVNLLGQYYPDSSIFSDADFRRFLIYSPQYFGQKGTPIFADFLSFSVNARLFVYRLWDSGPVADPRSEEADPYRSFIGISEDPAEVVTGVTTTVQANVGPNILPAGTYRFQVAAYFPREVVLIDTEAQPSAPVSATVNGTQQVKLDWEQADGAQGYRVYGGTGNDLVLLQTIINPATTTFTYSGQPAENTTKKSRLAVWYGGEWFPTSHVNIEYDREKFIYDLNNNVYGGFSPEDANKALSLLFNLIAPIQLVLNSIVINESLPAMDVHLEAAIHEILIEDSGL